MVKIFVFLLAAVAPFVASARNILFGADETGPKADFSGVTADFIGWLGASIRYGSEFNCNHANWNGLEIINSTLFGLNCAAATGVYIRNTVIYGANPNRGISPDSNFNFYPAGFSHGESNSIAGVPRFLGGNSPTANSGFRLSASSSLIRAGTNVGPLLDFGNRYFSNPPSIGAWEYASGDQRGTATLRSSVSARSSASLRTTVNPR